MPPTPPEQPADDRADDRRAKRQLVRMPLELGIAFHDTAERNGATTSALCYHWVLEAAAMADTGRGQQLPQQAQAPYGTLGRLRNFRWKQGDDEYARARNAIEGAGSSVAAVLRERAQTYVDTGGDAIGMAWRPKSRPKKVA